MAIYIQITVIPRSGRQEIKMEVKQDTAGLKCYLKQTPEAGKANQELIKFLAKQLHITQQQITIVTGKTGRKKRLKIDVTWQLDELLKELEL